MPVKIKDNLLRVGFSPDGFAAGGRKKSTKYWHTGKVHKNLTEKMNFLVLI